MVKELSGKSVLRRNTDIRIIDWEDVPAILKEIDDNIKFDFLESFIEVYENDQDKAYLLGKKNDISGILVGHTDPYNQDLIVSVFQYSRDIKRFKNLLSSFEYLGSKKGKRWVGFTPGTDEEKKLSEEMGWEESHLPSFWVEYLFEKKI